MKKQGKEFAKSWAEKQLLEIAVKIKFNPGDDNPDYDQPFSYSALTDQMIYSRTAYRVDKDGNFSGWLTFEEILKLPHIKF